MHVDLPKWIFWETTFWPLRGAGPQSFTRGTINPLNWLSSQTCGARWPQFGLCLHISSFFLKLTHQFAKLLNTVFLCNIYSSV